MPTPFMDITFPNAVGRGATGGPGFSTTVVTLASGDENRNSNWAKARGNWDISTGIRTRAQMSDVVAHFYVVCGKAYSFRFKDWSDYDAADVTIAPALEMIELDVMREVITGKLNKQIAADLGTGEQNIKIHRMRMMEKMGVASVAELVRVAERLGVEPAGS